jgi:hypothetical protein
LRSRAIPEENQPLTEFDRIPKESQRLSAKASRRDGVALSEAEIEAAEAEAEAWARRVNSC